MPNPIVTYYEPGAGPVIMYAGDFLLTRNLAPWYTRQGAVSALIRFGQWLRRKNWHASHAVAISEGHLVEALGHGVERSPLDKYQPVEYWYVHTDLDDGQRADFVAYVESMADNHTKYAYLAFLSCALILATGLQVGLGRIGHVICSGLVAAALGTYQWRSNPSFVMPADLAEYHGIDGQA